MPIHPPNILQSLFHHHHHHHHQKDLPVPLHSPIPAAIVVLFVSTKYPPHDLFYSSVFKFKNASADDY
jgi:hypothetical protein